MAFVNSKKKSARKKKRILVTLLMDAQEREALRSIADFEHTSQSAIVRTFIISKARDIASDLREKNSEVPKGLEI